MRVQIQILYPQYKKLAWYRISRNPHIIYFSLMGVAMLVLGVLHFSNIAPEPVTEINFPLAEFVFGVVTLVTIYASMKQGVKKNLVATNAKLYEPMEYDINEERMKVSGDGFDTEIQWEKIYKLEELKKWFMVYTNKKTAYIIPKHEMTDEEVSELRKILKNVSVVSCKKLK